MACGRVCPLQRVLPHRNSAITPEWRSPRPWESDEGLWEKRMDKEDMRRNHIRILELLSSIFSGFLQDKSFRCHRKRWRAKSEMLSEQMEEGAFALVD